MRIIAGALKGRRLQGPKGPGIRPTSDKLRETIFNILQGEVEDRSVLDGFAGTGAMGLEALSRGARAVTFVERDPSAIRLLRTNIAACGAEEPCVIIRDSFLGFSARHRGLGRFDLVFVDPPYDIESLEQVVIEAERLVAPSGLLILEHSRRRPAPNPVTGLACVRTIEAGDSALALYVPRQAT